MASTSIAEQPLEGGGERQSFGAGLVEDGGQRFGGGVQLELGEVAAELLVEARRRRAVDGWVVGGSWSGGGGHVQGVPSVGGAA